jgi:GT2 family glycosyltransferase
MPVSRALPHANRDRPPDVGSVSVGGELLALSSVDERIAIAVVDQLSTRSPLTGGWCLSEIGGQRIRVAAIPLEDDRHLIVVGARGKRHLPSSGTLTLATADASFMLTPDIDSAEVPVEELARVYLAELDEAVRTPVGPRIVESVNRFLSAPTEGISKALLTIREATRRRLRPAVIAADSVLAVNVEGIWRLDDTSYYLEGWVADRLTAVQNLTVLTPEGRGLELHERAFRYPRSDVSSLFGLPADQQLGFIAYLELSEPSMLDDPWLLQAGTAEGGVETALPSVVEGDAGLRTMILHDLEHERPPRERLRTQHIRPALARLERRLTDAVAIESLDEFGVAPEAPRSTMIIPLYRKLEFFEAQMAEFVQDPEVAASDVLYILDSPDDASACRYIAEQLFDLYGMPFRLAVLNRNGGYSRVNNLGASVSRSNRLILLNSDVLPSRPGWISAMIEFYDSISQMGALAPKLLYEDDSIQHAGLYFHRLPGAGVWSNEHYYKGLHRTFAPANVARRVPAVTGACLMIAKALYDELGGMSGQYIRGDYEDSDLCMRLHERGREAWYIPHVELYHLEGQSYPTADRMLASSYNQWLHTWHWKDLLGSAS